MKTKLKWLFYITVFLSMMPILAWASGFTIERTQMIFHRDPNVANGLKSGGPKINSFNLSRDDGMLLAGSTDLSHSLFLKMNRAGKLEWLKSIDQKWPVYFAYYTFDSSDGGYWGIGYAYSRDIREEQRKGATPLKPYELQEQVGYQYLLRMNSNGEPLAQSRLSTIETHNVRCGIDVKDGLIFTGWDHITYDDPSAPSGKRIITVPWIEKTDKDGKTLWQKTFAEDSNEVLELRFDLQSQNHCKGLMASSGEIVWATTVKPTALEHVGEKDVLRKSQQPSIPHFETVLFALDQAGNEIHRVKSKDVDKAFLFPVSDGFSLVEHYQPHIPDSIMKLPPLLAAGPIELAYSAGGGVRVTKLDANFQVLNTYEYKIPAINDSLGDVFLQQNEVYLLAGCNNEQVQAIVYLNNISNKFDVSSIYSHKQMNQCAEFGWTENPLDNDLLLFAGNSLDGYKLLTIKHTPQ